jgi:uncharacterized protein (TIGR02265 family)
MASSPGVPVPADRSDLKQRLAAVTAADTSRGLNYTTLFALVRDHLGDAAAREVDVLGKGARVDFFSYPVQEYLQTTWNAVDRLEATFGAPEAVLVELGRRTITGFLATMIGRTAFTMAGKDPRRLLANIGPSYRTAVSYGERKVEFTGPKRAVATFRHDFMPPPFHQAVILTALQAGDARRPRVVGRPTGPLDSVYEIEWE